MTARLFRLTEMHQRIDESLRRARARRQADPAELSRLMRMKARVKHLLHRLAAASLSPNSYSSQPAMG